MNTSLRFAVSTVAALASAAALGGCATMGRGSSSGSSGYRGTVMVQNQSGLRVCAVEPYVMGERHPTVSTELAPGASATFTAERDFPGVQVVECDTHRLLYGDPLAYLNDRQMSGGPLRSGSITLLAPDASPASGEGWSLPLAPVDPDEALRHYGVACMSRRDVPDGYAFMQDAGLAEQGLTLTRAAARRAGWTERYTVAVLVSDDWAPVQERRMTPAGPAMVTVARRVTFMVGARHDTGACTMRGLDLRQAFDGSEASGDVGLGGVGPVYQIPCSLLDAAGSFPAAATAG